MSVFGKNIKKLRSLNKLSQLDFGNLFGLSRASIGSYEEGRADPKIDSLIKIAHHFKLNIDDLLTKELFDLQKQVAVVKKEDVSVVEKSKSYLEDRVESLEKRLSKIEEFLNQRK